MLPFTSISIIHDSFLPIWYYIAGIIKFISATSNITSDMIAFRASHPYSLLDDNADSLLTLESNQVKSIYIETNILLGDLWVTYGEVEWGWSFYPIEGEPASQHQIGYSHDLVSFSFSNPRVYCSPDQFRKLLYEKLRLWVGRDMKAHPIIDTVIAHPTLWHFANDTLNYGCNR